MTLMAAMLLRNGVFSIILVLMAATISGITRARLKSAIWTRACHVWAPTTSVKFSCDGAGERTTKSKETSMLSGFKSRWITR